MRRNTARWLLVATCLSLVATACGGGSGLQANQPASEVEPPSALDTERTGLPGLVVATNSPSLRRLAEAPEGEGAVILFIEPGGPADGLGLGRGDLIISVNGEEVLNHQRGLALLHDEPGVGLEVGIRNTEGRERTITLEPREPLGSLRQYLNPLVEANPEDPILRFVRAQAAGVLSNRLEDLDQALEVDERFVEAITLRASLIWDNRPDDPQRVSQFVEEALNGWQTALEIDPDNTTTLSIRSAALSNLGSAQQGRRDATQVIELDETYPRGYYALAVAERTLRRPERAASPAHAAVVLDPFNAVYWRVLAQTFMDLERPDDCKRTAEGFAPFLEAQNFDSEAADLRGICT